MTAPGPAAESAQCRLLLLRDVRLLGAAGTDITPRNRKMRGLFAYLALASEHSAQRDRIADLLWSDRGQPQARASLRQSLVDLKATAPEAALLLLADRMQIALASPLLACDLHDLERAIEARDIGALAARLGEVGETVLGGLDGLSPALDDWLRTERVRFEERLTQRALALAAAAADVDLASARLVAAAISRLFEAQEEAVQIAMRLDHAAGDMAGVHRRFRQLESALRQEYGTAPSSATRALLTDLVAAPPMVGPAAPGADAPIVVVLPFASLDGDVASESLVRVLCHDLEAALCRLPDLRVLSLNQPTPERLARVGGRAIASYALSGSVRPGVEGVRFTFRLAEIDSSRVVWSGQIAADPSHMGQAIDSAVDKVAGATLPAVERDLVRSRRLEQAAPAAYSLYLRGRTAMLAARTHAAVKAAADLFEEAIRVDPAFVNPRIHLSLLYNNSFMHQIAGDDPLPWRVRAMDMARQAVQLEPENAHSQSRLAWCHLRHSDWNQALAMFRSIAAGASTHPDLVEECAVALVLLGEHGEAHALMQRAFALNPFPRSDYFADMALIDLFTGRHEAAHQHFAFASDPALQYGLAEVAALALDGQAEAARAMAAQMRAAFAAIWAGPGAPSDARLLETLDRFLPLRAEADRALLRTGLAMAGIAGPD